MSASSAPLPGEELPLTIIRPQRGWQSLGLGDLWRFRELLFFLAWRDIKVRYKQTVLGVAWAVLQPVLATIVFAVFFGKLGGLERHTALPYAVFVYAGMLAWGFFAEAVSQASQSLIASANLLTKVYFPRLVVPAAAVGGLMVDFAISLVVMGCLMAGYGVAPPPAAVAIPLLILATVAAALGAGALLAALAVAYRDFRYIVPFLLQIWMFASPVAYPLALVPEPWRIAYSLNPMAGIIDGFRGCLLGEPLHGACVAVSACSSVIFLIVGAACFRRLERHFADIV
jgi:lipopolysaccharide transport system permease protein